MGRTRNVPYCEGCGKHHEHTYERLAVDFANSGFKDVLSAEEFHNMVQGWADIQKEVQAINAAVLKSHTLNVETATLKNREKALRAYYRNRAIATGAPIPEWAQKKAPGRKAKSDL